MKKSKPEFIYQLAGYATILHELVLLESYSQRQTEEDKKLILQSVIYMVAGYPTYQLNIKLRSYKRQYKASMHRLQYIESSYINKSILAGIQHRLLNDYNIGYGIRVYSTYFNR